MPRYEIVAHIAAELDCETAEEAAALFRRRVLAEARFTEDLLHLAVWREEPHSTDSPLPPSLRQQLSDFFVALERCAGAAEEAFRERVAAILTSAAPVTADTADPNWSGPPDRAASANTQESPT